MTKAFRFYEAGGPEVLRWEDVTLEAPAPGQALVRQVAVGLNFIDIYHRSGLYPVPLPSGLGLEAAGVVEAVGAGVTEVKPGDRVAYVGGPLGAYAEARLFPAARLVRLPDTVSFELAAASMLKGMTVQYLLRRTFPVQPGQTILFHAAAGGVGLIAMQWSKLLGATVIGTVSTEEKAALARANGCDHTILYTQENFVDRVREITGGRGVPVVYDSIGKDTFEGSLACLAPFGMMVSFGNASGPVPPLALTALKGSLFITRPSVMAYTETRADLEATASEWLGHLAEGRLKIRVEAQYPLEEAPQAHAALASRKTSGSSVLMV